MPSLIHLKHITAGIVLGLLPCQAHAEQCDPAGAAVEVRASVSGSDTLTVSYTVVNNTRSSIAWIRIGSAGPERTQLIPQQTPVITSAPRGWTAMVVYPEETSDMHLWWEMKDGSSALQPGMSTRGFAVQVPGPSAVQPGLRGVDGRLVRPIDFARLPFTVGGRGMQCWWGRVRSTAGPRGHGDRPNIGIQLTALRAAAELRRWPDKLTMRRRFSGPKLLLFAERQDR